MRHIRHTLAALVLLLCILAMTASAEVVQVTYTEPDETVAGNLAYCDIHRCFGVVCADWQKIKRIEATSTIGGQQVIEEVVIDLQLMQMPLTVRFAVSCTDTSGNESSLLATTGGATGNPITFTAP